VPRLKLAGETCWGLGILSIIVLLGIIVPLVSPYDPLSGNSEALAPPSRSNLFGTDNLGRDVFTRTFAAAGLNISLALAGVGVPLVIGTLLGTLIGTTRSIAIAWFWVSIIDGINAFPFIVLVIAIVAMIGPGVYGILIGLVLTNWARYAKIARAKALALREAEFVQAAYVLGYSRLRILVKHVLPNVISEGLAYGISDFVIVIITVAGLSFMGLGVRPPTPEWGAMMADGRLYLQQEWWITVFPGLVLSLTGIGVALAAYGLERSAKGEE
jgi:peptide/nickel transport system permease protein